MDNSGLNTILLVAIVVILVGAAVWYFTSQAAPEPEASIELSLPSSDSE